MDVWNAFRRGGGDEGAAVRLGAAGGVAGFPQRAAFKHALHLCGMPETRVRPPEGELTPERKRG